MPNAGRADPPSQVDDVIATIREQLRRLRLGSIAITVHEGQIVQLDVTEKRRLQSSRS